MADVRFLLTGDTSVCVEFGNEISEAINAKIRAYNIALQNSQDPRHRRDSAHLPLSDDPL